MSTASPHLTGEDLMALPDDGIDRDIIRGELKRPDERARSPFYILRGRIRSV